MTTTAWSGNYPFEGKCRESEFKSQAKAEKLHPLFEPPTSCLPKTIAQEEMGAETIASGPLQIAGAGKMLRSAQRSQDMCSEIIQLSWRACYKSSMLFGAPGGQVTLLEATGLTWRGMKSWKSECDCSTLVVRLTLIERLIIKSLPTHMFVNHAEWDSGEMVLPLLLGELLILSLLL